MPLIVADTTSLNYLVLIDAVESLPSLYRRVLTPAAVRAELAHPSAPNVVRRWIESPPEWLEVASPAHPSDRGLAHLDLGEREAISLAEELRSGLLLMDERDGVRIARQRGLKVVGTIGVLDLAAERGLLDLRTMFDLLHETTFRSPLRIMSKMLEQDAERKKRTGER